MPPVLSPVLGLPGGRAVELGFEKTARRALRGVTRVEPLVKKCCSTSIAKRWLFFRHLLRTWLGPVVHFTAVSFSPACASLPAQLSSVNGRGVLTPHPTPLAPVEQTRQNTQVMQDVKDSLSYVSLDLDSDLRAARVVKPGNPIVR